MNDFNRIHDAGFGFHDIHAKGRIRHVRVKSEAGSAIYRTVPVRMPEKVRCNPVTLFQ
jgi:hypothetical protein